MTIALILSLLLNALLLAWTWWQNNDIKLYKRDLLYEENQTRGYMALSAHQAIEIKAFEREVREYKNRLDKINSDNYRYW